MTEQQRPQLLTLIARITEFANAFLVLSGDDMQWIIQNTKQAISLFCEAVKNRIAKTGEKLLEFVSTMQIEAIDRFVAREKFQEGKTIDGVTIAWLGPNFKKHYLGKVEGVCQAAELKLYKLLTSATDLPREDRPGIIPELAGRHEIKLGQFHRILAHKQRTKDFTWIVAYIIGEDGCVLGAVSAGWDDDGWYIEADSVARPGPWSVGYEIVSR